MFLNLKNCWTAIKPKYSKQGWMSSINPDRKISKISMLFLLAKKILSFKNKSHFFMDRMAISYVEEKNISPWTAFSSRLFDK